MPNNLYEALKLDLDSCGFNEKQELRGMLRYFLGQAYVGKEDNSITSRYVKEKGISKINEEIMEIASSRIYKGKQYLSYEVLLDKISDVLIDDYLKSKNEINSFNEVMQKTLSYYQAKFNPEDKSEVVKFAKIILSDYFDNKHVYIFSSKNGTRTYVTKRSPEQILDEMSKELKMTSSVPGAVISVYANKVANDWIKNNMKNYEENGLNSITDMIDDEINRANLNDRQKTYLINEFQNGNVDALERYIPQNLIDEYKKVSTSLNDGNYSK